MNRWRVLVVAIVFAAIPPRLAVSAEDGSELYRSALSYMESGDFDRGITALSKAIDRNPQFAEAYYERGACFARKRVLNKAIADYSEAIRLKPATAEFYDGRSNAYIDQRECAKALKDCRESLRLDPKNALVHITRGRLYWFDRQLDNALSQFNEAVRLAPGDPRPWISRGAAYAKKGIRDKAVADFAEAIRLDDRYSDAYFFRGRALLAMKKEDDAIADFTQTIRLTPGRPEVYLMRGIAYEHKLEHDRAVEDLTEAIRLDSGSADAFFQRANVHWRKGDRAKAGADFDSCLKLSPKRFDFLENGGAFRVTGGDYQGGAADLRAAVALDACDPAADFEPVSSKAIDPQAMKFGEEQVRQMLRDRPKMAQYGDKAAELYRWAARKFAGEDLGQVVHWVASEPRNINSTCTPPTAREAANIRIRKTYWDGNKKGKDESFEELWRCAVFELYNICGGTDFETIDVLAARGLIEKEAFITRNISIESRAAEKTRAFYIYRFLPWAAKQRVETDPRRWFIGSRSSAREDLLLGRVDRQSPSWRYYETYFEDRSPGKKDVKKLP